MRQKIKPAIQAPSDGGSFLQLHQVSSCSAPGLSCCPLGTEHSPRATSASLAMAVTWPTGTGWPLARCWHSDGQMAVTPSVSAKTNGCPTGHFPKNAIPLLKATPILLGGVRVSARSNQAAAAQSSVAAGSQISVALQYWGFNYKNFHPINLQHV